MFGVPAHGVFDSVLQGLPGHQQSYDVLLLLGQPLTSLVMGDHGHVPAVDLVVRKGNFVTLGTPFGILYRNMSCGCGSEGPLELGAAHREQHGFYWS